MLRYSSVVFASRRLKEITFFNLIVSIYIKNSSKILLSNIINKNSGFSNVFISEYHQVIFLLNLANYAVPQAII